MSVALLSALAPGSVAGARIVAVVSSDAQVFEQALEGVKRRIDDVKVVRLDAGKPVLSDADVVIAIGSKALAHVADLPAGVRIVTALVPESDPELARAKGRPVEVVGLYAPPDALVSNLRKLVPEARHLWAIHSPAPASIIAKLELAARSAGFTLTATPVSDAGAAVRALRNPPERVDAFVMLPDPVVRNGAFDQALLRLAFERRFPVIGVSRFDVRSGALYALQLDPQAIGEEAASVARRLAEHPTAARGEAVPPSGPKLVVNVATARRLGVTVSAEVQRQAAELFGQ